MGRPGRPDNLTSVAPSIPTLAQLGRHHVLSILQRVSSGLPAGSPQQVVAQHGLEPGAGACGDHHMSPGDDARVAATRRHQQHHRRGHQAQGSHEQQARRLHIPEAHDVGKRNGEVHLDRALILAARHTTPFASEAAPAGPTCEEANAAAKPGRPCQRRALRWDTWCLEVDLPILCHACHRSTPQRSHLLTPMRGGAQGWRASRT
mmetsp:Transcript_165677/g.531898  ORF Transcript_165677/g.531898 Transcript_165677/m.531898 type:complete len:205 (+) Transcript_165677:719-1333(+)